MRTFLCVISVVCLTFIGCSKTPNPDGRLDVSGTITLNGGPFPDAEMCGIAMIPLDDKSAGNSSTTFDRETGEYLFTRQEGLKPGKHKVILTAQAVYDRKTKQPVTPETNEGDDYRINLIPAEFNKNSTIVFEVMAGKPNVFDYNIETSFVPNTRPTKMVLPN